MDLGIINNSNGPLFTCTFLCKIRCHHDPPVLYIQHGLRITKNNNYEEKRVKGYIRVKINCDVFVKIVIFPSNP